VQKEGGVHLARPKNTSGDRKEIKEWRGVRKKIEFQGRKRNFIWGAESRVNREEEIYTATSKHKCGKTETSASTRRKQSTSRIRKQTS
jgi:hypothetical protein